MVDKIVKSTCTFCLAGCGVLIHIKDGFPVKIEGNPNHPVNQGELCAIGKASLECLNHPDRLTHPLKRVGSRGEGKWEKISWDEALKITGLELTKIKDRYGVEAVAFMQGCAKGYQDSYLARFANAFGSPNASSTAYVCHHSRMRSAIATYGYMSVPDYDYTPACVILWALNRPATAFPMNSKITEALKGGAKLIVIDPAETKHAKTADIWVKPRPVSDLALALGMINVIINEELFDREYVGKWTVGFDKLRTHVQGYTPEKVSEITWVPVETIREIARIYATNKPAWIIDGNGGDNNMNNYQFGRAVAILRAITGNVGIQCGEVEWAQPNVISKDSLEMHRHDLIQPEMRARRVGIEENILPNFFAALPQKLLKAMLTSKPYPVRAALVQGASMLHTFSNAIEVYNALKSLDFFVAIDLFMTPTTELADIVLPVGTYLEINSIHPPLAFPVSSVVQKVAQRGECWSDFNILNELGKHLGLHDDLWESEEWILNYILKPSGKTFEELKQIGFIPGVKKYRILEKDGFNTPSGKIELYSGQLEEWGFDPLPIYNEPPESPFSEPDMLNEYPYVLTSWKIPVYIHSRGRQIKSLRDKHPNPLILINEAEAKKFNIKSGNWICIETKRGKIRHKAALSANIDPRIVILEHGWWFPEKTSALSGWDESNVNILTSSDPPYGRELGSVSLRGILCKIYKEN
jgi:anaerobic selenocysteine-containing dehydrogenase